LKVSNLFCLKSILLILILLLSSTIDLLSQRDSIATQNNDTNSNSFTSIFYGEPGRAALYSLIIPGAGQFYNKRYWKVPLVYLGEGIAGYFLISSQRTFRRRDTCWRSLVESPNNPSTNCGTVSDVQTAFNLRQSARSQRETAWIGMGAVHLLNIVEAFVDRHLINFDTTEDLSYHNLPNTSIRSISDNQYDIELITLRISLNKRVNP